MNACTRADSVNPPHDQTISTCYHRAFKTPACKPDHDVLGRDSDGLESKHSNYYLVLTGGRGLSGRRFGVECQHCVAEAREEECRVERRDVARFLPILKCKKGRRNKSWRLISAVKLIVLVRHASTSDGGMGKGENKPAGASDARFSGSA